MPRPEPIDEEFFFDDGVIISETDLQGNILFANRKFAAISGYSQDELKGKPHNILRHPDMPKAAFAQMWKTIESGKKWSGLIKNLRKDGRYYWVKSEIQPEFDEKGHKKGYIAARKVASREDIERAIKEYKKFD